MRINDDAQVVCSTPFGITDFDTSRSRDVSPSRRRCSTPFGITDFDTLYWPTGMSGTVGVDLPKDSGVGQRGVDSEGGGHRWPARPTPASSNARPSAC